MRRRLDFRFLIGPIVIMACLSAMSRLAHAEETTSKVQSQVRETYSAKANAALNWKPTGGEHIVIATTFLDKKNSEEFGRFSAQEIQKLLPDFKIDEVSNATGADIIALLKDP